MVSELWLQGCGCSGWIVIRDPHWGFSPVNEHILWAKDTSVIPILYFRLQSAFILSSLIIDILSFSERYALCLVVLEISLPKFQLRTDCNKIFSNASGIISKYLFFIQYILAFHKTLYFL
ncbi:hypothetical protein AOQ84DRAFT_153293 [Glonium stellatum]|uniref:Uncharacterized protein n=1 Tax=Glonium stellatum TaxID=574774 RepID=A0A8E2JWV2_9PEZI|nr:hypothetical protein AOQ84DRAFT_153293 [Glonium stellatum]